LPVGASHEYNLSQDLAMRRIAVISIIASLALACGSGTDAADKADEKAGDPNAQADAQPEQPPPTVPAAEMAPTPAPAPTPTSPQPAPPPADEFGGEFCETIIPCYQKLEFAGNFTADVTVDIEPDGSVSAVSFTGEAPKPVKTCITDAIKNTKLADYNGKPGRTRCTKSGQLMGGTQMIMSDRTYEVRDPSASKSKAKANNDPHGKAGDTKGAAGDTKGTTERGKAGAG
jgi:hypothetical protein